jgi:hypothetical protein
MGLVELGRYPNSAVAHIIRGRLQAEGIEAFCFDTGMNLAEGAPLLFPVRLMVLDEDLADARRLLGEAEPATALRAPQPGAARPRQRRAGHDPAGGLLASWLARLRAAFTD